MFRSWIHLQANCSHRVDQNCTHPEKDERHADEQFNRSSEDVRCVHFLVAFAGFAIGGVRRCHARSLSPQADAVNAIHPADNAA
jgi:hypothetical protein